MAHLVQPLLVAHHQSGGAHLFPKALARIEAIEPGEGPRRVVERCVVVEDVDHLQPVAQADFVVVGVVARRHLERARAELHVDIGVGNHGDAPAEDGHNRGAPHQLRVARVVRVDGHGGVAQNCFGARRADLKELVAAAPLKHVLEGVEAPLLLLVVDLEVTDGAHAAGTPVDQPLATVDQPLVVEANEGLEHRLAESGIKGEALAFPIA